MFDSFIDTVVTSLMFDFPTHILPCLQDDLPPQQEDQERKKEIRMIARLSGELGNLLEDVDNIDRRRR